VPLNRPASGRAINSAGGLGSVWYDSAMLRMAENCMPVADFKCCAGREMVCRCAR
jgi:hypothetical protein